MWLQTTGTLYLYCCLSQDKNKSGVHIHTQRICRAIKYSQKENTNLPIVVHREIVITVQKVSVNKRLSDQENKHFKINTLLEVSHILWDTK